MVSAAFAHAPVPPNPTPCPALLSGPRRPPHPSAEQSPAEGDEELPAEESADLHRCAALGPTRELLAARAGITHKDIRGDRELELIRRYQGGDRNAGEILLRAHAKLIAYYAKKWSGGRHDLTAEEILAEAQLGFLHGVEKFDPAMGVKLTTYAMGWIRPVVTRAKIEQGHTIYVPHLHHETDKGQMRERTREAGRAALSVHRLDAPIGDEDDGSTFGDFVAAPDNTEGAVASRDWDETTAEMLADALRRMPPRLADILRRRAAGETLEELGAAYGLTKERIRQLEAKARKLAQKRLGKEGRERLREADS